MSAITTLTRMWLTRTTKPFIFTGEYDEVLPYSECEGLGLYVHIPFCKSLCAFCPYCKTVYSGEKCDRYIDALLREIELVGSRNGGRKTVTSLYFGGGTPALAADRIGDVIAALRKYFDITEGIGLELHPDNVTADTLRVLSAAGVTKISIGIQSFLPKYQNLLGRKPIDTDAMAAALREVRFETVSMDFIFALPGQTFDDLASDIDRAFEIGANHVAIYPFIDFTFTPGKVKPLGKRQKRELLDSVTRYCAQKGLVRDSIWTFSSGKNAKYSSMTRDNFLGFGCSATTLLNKQFKVNTFSVEEYIRRIDGGKLPTALTIRFTPRQRMIYYLFWTLYSTRLDPVDFEKFFGVPLDRMYGLEFRLARLLGFLTFRDGVYRMTLKGAFYYHHYENYYTLAYIDKMWGIMREQAFPEKIEL